MSTIVSSADIMCDRPKIHVFLGAPPPSSGPASMSGGGVDGEEHPAADWTHLELTWQDGRLRPAGEAFRDPTGRTEKRHVFSVFLNVTYCSRREQLIHSNLFKPNIYSCLIYT